MNRSQYQAGPAGEAEVQPQGSKWTLVLVRELRHPAQQVWSTLTQPTQLRQWAPFDTDRDLGQIGRATLTMAGGESGGVAERFKASVGRAEPPTLLEYTWDTDVLRWELEPGLAGTRLTLRHTMDDRTWVPKIAAGWHICLDVADQLLSGQPIGRIVAGEARHHGWDRLNEAYAARFGIPSTGFPEESPHPSI
jgi:uncharacterized protein YndB with AHSA1/START domain